jgi:hypothetical protein
MMAMPEDEVIKLNMATLRHIYKLAGALFGIISFVWWLSSTVHGMQSDIALQLQQINSKLDLQNEQTNARIDYLQGEIDADCFGRTTHYRKQTPPNPDPSKL